MKGHQIIPRPQEFFRAGTALPGSEIPGSATDVLYYTAFNLHSLTIAWVSLTSVLNLTNFRKTYRKEEEIIEADHQQQVVVI